MTETQSIFNPTRSTYDVSGKQAILDILFLRSTYNVTALTGKQAILICAVRNIGNESVFFCLLFPVSLQFAILPFGGGVKSDRQAGSCWTLKQGAAAKSKCGFVQNGSGQTNRHRWLQKQSHRVRIYIYSVSTNFRLEFTRFPKKDARC